MPNWTENSITIEGDAADLQQIADARFDFQILHPCPFQEHEGWYEWCCKYWGNKWSPADPDIDYSEGDTILNAHFQTAWCAPHAFLAYLTTIYPSLTITNEWDNENYDKVGITIYTAGTVISRWIDPTLYTRPTLEAFAASNSWFSYENYCNMFDDDEEDVQNVQDAQDAQDQIVVNHVHTSYEEIIA